MASPTNDTKAAKEIVKRRHFEWKMNSLTYRWLLDSLEGGDRYKYAVYGRDRKGWPVHNLLRHKREVPDEREASSVELYPSVLPSWLGAGGGFTDQEGQDQRRFATDSDFYLRLARTPIPTFVEDAIANDLGKIFSREVHRTAPDDITAWWNDVDGCGTTMDRWVRKTIGPLVMAIGGLDLVFDHPPVPDGETVVSEADVQRLKLGGCEVGYILPENMLDWKLDRKGHYLECLVREQREGKPGEDTNDVYRHWTASGWTLYDKDGKTLGRGQYKFGRPPIVRVFDGHRARAKHVPKSRYESIADKMREYYNRDSELILSDTLQAHPMLQGPSDAIQEDGSISLGPSYLLPMFKSGTDGSYTGFEFVEPPKGGAESLRQNKYDLREEVDRSARFVKASGLSGMGKGTVEQSGISKQIDHQEANDRLGEIADTLKRVEMVATAFARMVMSDGASDPWVPVKDIDIVYPSNFDLYTASDVAVAASDFFNLAAMTGNKGLEDAEKSILKRHIRLVMPAQTDAVYRQYDADIDAFIDGGGGAGAQMEQLQQKLKLAPAGGVRDNVNDPTARLQPAGQTGKSTTGSN